jgi:N-hydroxyarylamine O-acetyltransferase
VPAGGLRLRTHMLLRVSVATERHLVDAGFGGLTCTAPLRLDRRSPQVTPHGTFRLPLASGGYEPQAAVAGDWRALYAFDLQPQQAAGFEMASWYLCRKRSGDSPSLSMAKLRP